MSNPFDEMIEESKRKEKENIKNMTLEQAIETTNNIADMAVYNYIPNKKNEMILKGKPIYMLGDEGRTAIKTVLQELKRYKRLAEANLKDSEEFKNNMCEHRCILKSELQEFQENSIRKKKIEEYLAEETEKYKVYKKEVDKNENLRPQLWNHLGRKNMCEKILGIEKTVTLY